MSDINFTANYIKPVQIKKLQGIKYKPYEASLVELTKEDIPSLKQVSRNWKSIIITLIECDSSIYLGNKNYHFYALTKQKENFAKLNTNDMLGVMEVETRKDLNKIIGLQTNPEYISYKYGSFKDRVKTFVKKLKEFKPFREYKHIGKELLNSVKEQSPNTEIELQARKQAINFYKKQGFKHTIFSTKANTYYYEPIKNKM